MTLPGGSQIRLSGAVDDAMLATLLDGLEGLSQDEGVTVELFTLGGDAEIGRRIASQVRSERARRSCRFHGITAVYSAGVTIMAAFPREDRLLSSDCVLEIHERRMTRTIELGGSLEACLRTLKETINEVRSGIQLERRGFTELAAGSQVSADEVVAKAREGWYLSASEALDLGLVGGLLDEAALRPEAIAPGG